MSTNSTLAPGMKQGAITADVSSQEQAIKNAWAIDPNWDDYIMYALYAMYALTIIPSYAGLPFIFSVKAFIDVYLLVDMILKLVNLSSYPASESYIWNMNNWWFYSFRRLGVSVLLQYVHPYT